MATEPVEAQSGESDERRNQYENRTAKALIIASFAYLVVYSAEVLWLSMPSSVRAVVAVITTALYLVFLADFATRVYLSTKKWQYIAANPLDLLIIVLPAFRALRILRVFAALRVIFTRAERVNLGRAWLGLATAVALVVFIASLAVLEQERFAEDTLIANLPDALWWGFVTITTVGYGDTYPVTTGGQMIAVFLMLVGIGLLGTVTATVAGWVADKLRSEQEEAEDEVMAELKALRAEIAELREELRGK